MGKWKVNHFPFSDNIYPVDPEHNLTIPFIRMVAGPMDYTPGAMTNVNRFDYKWSPADLSPQGFNALGQPLRTNIQHATYGNWHTGSSSGYVYGF